MAALGADDHACAGVVTPEPDGTDGLLAAIPQKLQMTSQGTVFYEKLLAYDTQSPVWVTKGWGVLTQRLVLNVKTFVFALKSDLRSVIQHLHGQRLLLRDAGRA